VPARPEQEGFVREQPVVVALGGNAIAPPGSRSPIPAQYERTMETAHHLVHLAERPLVVTHGNGPQVGNVLLRSDLAAHLLPRLPLDTCVADTQGGMGFMRHADAGQFAAGSMLPKVQAAIRFLARGGRRAVITTPELSEKALAGGIGTQVLP
jgi:carbamate kinase